MRPPVGWLEVVIGTMGSARPLPPCGGGRVAKRPGGRSLGIERQRCRTRRVVTVDRLQSADCALTFPTPLSISLPQGGRGQGGARRNAYAQNRIVRPDPASFLILPGSLRPEPAGQRDGDRER